LAELKTAFDTNQALNHCATPHNKRAISDKISEIRGIDKVEPMMIRANLAAKVTQLLAPPADWQGKYMKQGSDPHPHGLCPIYAKPATSEGKFCLCHDGKGNKIYPNCSVFDLLPPKLRNEIHWTHAKCLPVNCKPVSHNHTMVPLTVAAGLDSISDESTSAFVSQIGAAAGTQDVGLVDVSQGNGTSAGTTQLNVQLPASHAQALSSLQSLNAPNGNTYQVTVGDPNAATRLKWTYAVVGIFAVIAVAIIIMIGVLLVKGYLREKADKRLESDYTRYVKA